MLTAAKAQTVRRVVADCTWLLSLGWSDAEELALTSALSFGLEALNETEGAIEASTRRLTSRLLVGEPFIHQLIAIVSLWRWGALRAAESTEMANRTEMGLVELVDELCTRERASLAYPSLEALTQPYPSIEATHDF